MNLYLKMKEHKYNKVSNDGDVLEVKKTAPFCGCRYSIESGDEIIETDN